jgi:poly [ADP-ribose] polymerase
MEPVMTNGSEFATLQAYVRDTHGDTHRHYQVEIIHAFRVERDQETENWNRSGFNRLADGERLLLWHGSRTTNFAGAFLNTILGIIGSY